MTAVHQLVPVLSSGDAIGSAVLQTRDMLRSAGFDSQIYADVLDSRLRAEARPIADLDVSRLRADDAILYNLSIGSRLARLVERIPVRRIIAFHNITPPDYFRRVNPRVTYWLERGYQDLSRLAPLADLVLAWSTHNLEVALAAGARRGAVVAPAVDLRRLHPRPAAPQLPPTILFVGRIAPNKRQEDLLRALAALRATAIPDARLILAGAAHDTSPYLEGLLSLARRLGIADAVELDGGRLTDERLGSLYAEASVFACASEHEGFCVPIFEAFAFSVPVVARACTAVPETVGGAGLLLDTRDPLVWAEALARLVYDIPLRRTLIAAGLRRVSSFSEAGAERRLAQALREIDLVP